MNKLRRYYTALRRYSRSKGFGIHSPFAFDFVLRVLRERCRYYAYTDIENQRRQALLLASEHTRRPSVISLKNAKMLFRIICRFHPSLILQCGTTDGVSSFAMLNVDSNSRLIIYTGKNCHDSIYDKITQPYASRIDCRPSLSEAIDTYRHANADAAPFILVNDVSEPDFLLLADTIVDALHREGIVIVRNISRSPIVRRLWNRTIAAIPHGMSFSNDRIGIIVGYRRLPRQHFSLWF